MGPGSSINGRTVNAGPAVERHGGASTAAPCNLIMANLTRANTHDESERAAVSDYVTHHGDFEDASRRSDADEFGCRPGRGCRRPGRGFSCPRI